jgi:hypothetical protein
MREFITTLVTGLALTACAPSEDALTDGPLFEADGTPAAKPTDDLGYEAAREALRLSRDARVTPELDEDIRDRLDEVDTDCVRVAFLALRWSDADNDFHGNFYTLRGRPVAKTRGYHAPVGERGGTFAGQWAAPSTSSDELRGGPIGGIYDNDHSFTGQATYLGQPFELNGGWVRLDEDGGIALATVESCN